MINEIKKELELNKIRLELVKELNELSDSKNSNIKIGSRIRILSESGELELGRAIKFKSNGQLWEIERDSKRNNIGIKKDQLEPMYSGVKEYIDIKQWELTKRNLELEAILKNSTLPAYFNDKEYVNVKIVGRSEPQYGYCYLTCEIYKVNPVQVIKVPESSINIHEYYQIQTRNETIVKILPISKERYLGIE
jgi:hypothetical protein